MNVLHRQFQEVLNDLKYCVEQFMFLEDVVFKVFAFIRRYDASIELPQK